MIAKKGRRLMARLEHLTARGRETQRLLREALMQLSLEKGFEQITVKDITERAGIDRTTFYLHCTDKYDLLEKSQRDVIDELFAHQEGLARPGQNMVFVFQHVADHIQRYRFLLGVASPLLNRRLHSYMAERMVALLRARQAPEAMADDVMLDMVANFMTSSLRGTIRWWIEAGMPYTPDEMASYFQRLLLGGLLAFRPGEPN